MESLNMGAACSLAGLLAAWTVTIGKHDPGAVLLLVSSCIAGFVSGYNAWWWLVARRQQASRLRGILAGALAAVVGHFLASVLFFFNGYALLENWNAAPNSLQTNAFGGLFLGGMSLVAMGWFTIPMGAVLGYFGVGLRKVA